MVSTSPTHIDIQTPLSPVSLPSSPKVILFEPLPRPPCASWHKKIWHSPEQIPPNVGSSPQAQLNSQPSFSNQATLSLKSETFNIGVSAFAFITFLPYGSFYTTENLGYSFRNQEDYGT